MSHALSQITVHIIFGTKWRKNLLGNSLRPQVHAYLAKIAQEMHSYVLMIGGTENHVHIACTLPRTTSIAQFINKLKTTSSKMIKAKGIPNFSWQNGYGAFSVSRSQEQKVINYIKNQMEHHQKQTFEKEVELLLKKHHLPYDPNSLD